MYQAIFCEYSPKSGLQHFWKYKLPRIIDWTDGNTITLHELILKLAQGYKTNRMVAVIDNDKANIVGKVPSAEVRIVEKALNEVREVVDRVNRDMNRFLWLILSHLEDHRGDVSDDAFENTEVKRKKKKGKSTVAESDFEDEKQPSGSNSSGDSEEEKKEKKGGTM